MTQMAQTKHRMAEMNAHGDTTIEWDVDNADEVAAARRLFEMLVGRKNYSAFAVDDAGNAGGRVTEFNPRLRRIVLVPALQGGA